MSTSTDQGRHGDLMNDTRLNVAALLQEPVGSSREIRFDLDVLTLDHDLSARTIEGTARLTRLREAVLVSAKAQGTVELDCARCLRRYEQPVATEFAEEFRQTVDVHSGRDLVRGEAPDEDEDDEPGFWIDENHELDLAEALRQWIVLELPMRPDCGDLCAGPELPGRSDDDQTDSRFAALADLLSDDDRTRDVQ